ncbi:hypothetical protein MC885_015575 [Smutsia gigantea]|nr:hypothetical protein MC885_015575 [Smutsia gigantea]
MRQLKGKPKKETSKDKKERKQAMQEARQQITTVVLPTLAVVVLLIVVFVYVATRPAVTEYFAKCSVHDMSKTIPIVEEFQLNIPKLFLWIP